MTEAKFLVPRSGTYLVVQLDAAQMVEHLGDPVLTAAASKLRNHKYIGHIFEIEELPMPDKPDHKCCVALVGRGLCNQAEDEWIDSTMCVPIFPATEHPLSREPLRPTPSFPFSDCYQYSFATPDVRIPTKLYDHSNSVSLNSHDMVAHERYVSEDSRKRRALRDTKAGVVDMSRDEDSDSSQSRSLTSAEVRELASQGVPVFYTNKAQATRSADTQSVASANSQTTDDKAKRCAGDMPRSVPTVNQTETVSIKPVVLSPDSRRLGKALPFVEVRPEPAPRLHSELVDGPQDTAMSAPSTRGPPPECTVPTAVVPSPELLSNEEDASDSASTVSMIRSVSDCPSVPRSPISDVLMQAFLGDPCEDRDIIPLVNVSLNLSEVSKVHDPNGFFDEVDEIVRLIQESRDRHVGLGSDCKSMTSGSESWVDLAADIASSDVLNVARDEDDCPSMHGALHRARFRAKMKAKSQQARRCVVAILNVVTAVITCSSRVRVTFTLDD